MKSNRGKRYTHEFRQQMVQLVRGGRESVELSKEWYRFGRYASGSSRARARWVAGTAG